MANRKLFTMGFDKNLVDTMMKKGFTTSENLLGRPVIDVLYDLDLPLPTLQDIIRVVSVKIAPKAKTAKQLLDERSSDSSPLSTLTPLDHLLGGGLHTGTLTEVVGPPSIGKTQFCHMLALSAAFPRIDKEEASVLYFDTENAFSSMRLTEMASEIFISDEESILKLVQSVTVFQINTTNQLIDNLQTLEDEIIEKNVKLIIIDSLASVVRRDFPNEYMLERATFFNKLASLVKFYASEFNLSVVAINQTIATAGGGNIAGLGKVWSHCINTRLVFEFANESNLYYLANTANIPITTQLKKLTIAKSPVSPVFTVFYTISTAGLVILKQKEESSDMTAESSEAPSAKGVIIECSPQNFWEDIISANISDPSMNTSMKTMLQKIF